MNSAAKFRFLVSLESMAEGVQKLARFASASDALKFGLGQTTIGIVTISDVSAKKLVARKGTLDSKWSLTAHGRAVA